MFSFLKPNKKKQETALEDSQQHEIVAVSKVEDCTEMPESCVAHSTHTDALSDQVTEGEMSAQDMFEDEPNTSAMPTHTQASALQQIAQRHMNKEQLTDTELDVLADHCISHIKEILKGFGTEDSQIDEYAAEDGEFIFDILNPELGSLIGHHGKTLEATQFLLNAILSQEFGFKYRVYLDVESYKSRQRTKLEQVARKSAARARDEQRKVKLGFMSAYERRVVHMILNEEMGITTFSEGEDPYRRVVIVPRKDHQ